MYPRGMRPNRWQIMHMVCKYRDRHKPIYPPVSRDGDRTGASDKMRFTKSFLGLFRDAGYVIAFKLSQYVIDAWGYMPS